MISPEILRHYPLFHSFSDSQLRAIAMIAEEENVEAETTLFQKGQSAEFLYILKDGSIDLYFTTGDKGNSINHKGFLVGEINPGELFSISALIEPHILSSTASASRQSVIIKIEADALRGLFEKDKKLAYLFTYQAAKASIERLHNTHIQLAAAWA
jgi:CRP/FNR family transcriptional regulator, cyclic AMP receptor protein